jgi:hypothetical protein
MGLFEKGRPKTGGRTKGTPNKFSKAFDEALRDDFEKNGLEAIRITRVERPTEYLKIIASRFPQEFEITDSRLKEISDDELDAILEHLRQRIDAARAGSSGGVGGEREKSSLN